MNLDYFADLHRQGLPIVVDAAASFGTIVDSHWYGEGFPGFIVYSFHATKAFGIGEGGLVYSGDADAIGRLRRAGNFGFDTSRSSIDCGLNSKMSEYTAARALATWAQFPQKVERRRTIHRAYLQGLEERRLSERGWQVQRAEGDVPSQFMSILCPPDVASSAGIAKLAEAKVECRTYFNPACHQQPQFADCSREDMSVTDDLTRRILSLPLWETMPLNAVNRILDTLASV